MSIKILSIYFVIHVAHFFQSHMFDNRECFLHLVCVSFVIVFFFIHIDLLKAGLHFYARPSVTACQILIYPLNLSNKFAI